MITIQTHLSAIAAGHRVIDPANPMGDDFGGGSRAGFLGLARALGRLGKYRVQAIGTFNERKQTIDGVDYIRLDQTHKLDHPDVIHAFYDGSPLVGSQARLRIWSHHTYIPMGQSWDWTDVHTAPSRHSLKHLQQFDPLNAWERLPNAVEGLDGVTWKPEPGRVGYWTTPDRGLHILLGMWPAIRAAVPDATLHVVGDVDEMANYPGPKRSVRGRRAETLRENLATAQSAGGIELLGRLTRTALLEEIRQTNCFAFPCSVSAPCETWSISVHEALHVGVPVVTMDVDSLGEVWSEYATVHEKHHLDAFQDDVIRILQDHKTARQRSERGVRIRGVHTFDKTAAKFDEIVAMHLVTR